MGNHPSYCTNTIFDASNAGPHFHLDAINKLLCTQGASSGAECIKTTIGKSTGKWYAEFTIISFLSGAIPEFGLCDASANFNGELGADTHGWAVRSIGSGYIHNGFIFNGSIPAFTIGDTVSIAYDATNGAMYVAINGTWMLSGDPTSGATHTGAIFTGITGTIYMAAGVGTTPDCVFLMINGCTSFASHNAYLPVGYSAVTP